MKSDDRGFVFVVGNNVCIVADYLFCEHTFFSRLPQIYFANRVAAVAHFCGPGKEF